MFLRRVRQFLSLQLLQSTDHAETCVTGFDDIIDVTILSCIIRIGKQFCIFCFFFGKELSRIFLVFGFTRVQYFYCTCTTHYSDFSCWPSIVHVTTKLFTTHHDVRTTVRFTQCDCYFRYSSFTVSIQQFGTMKDNAIVFLACSRKESRYVYQRHDRDIESIAETNETCAFARCVAVEYTGKEFRLIGYNTYRLTVETGKTDNDILGIVFLDFQEFAYQ